MWNIAYTKGYKYQLAEDYEIALPTMHGHGRINEKYLRLTNLGNLLIREGYAWDGASGPVIDSSSNMRGSLVHDALYQLLRLDRLDPEYRDGADKIFRDLCIEDGISSWRAYAWYYGLFIGGKPAADPSNKKDILTAPE